MPADWPISSDPPRPGQAPRLRKHFTKPSIRAPLVANGKGPSDPVDDHVADRLLAPGEVSLLAQRAAQELLHRGAVAPPPRGMAWSAWFTAPSRRSRRLRPSLSSSGMPSSTSAGAPMTSPAAVQCHRRHDDAGEGQLAAQARRTLARRHHAAGRRHGRHRSRSRPTISAGPGARRSIRPLGTSIASDHAALLAKARWRIRCRISPCIGTTSARLQPVIERAHLVLARMAGGVHQRLIGRHDPQPHARRDC